MADNIVTDWLRSLNLVHYTQAFLDNGYDDLEICKQIGEPDLDAIGVHKPEHRYRVLEAVRILREQGGTAVYFTLENPEGPCPNSVLDRVGLISRDDGIGCVNSDVYHHTAGLGGVIGAMDRTGGDTPVPESIHYPRRMTDEYEEGKSALLTYPKIQLKHIIRDRLVRDDIDLSGPPYTTPDQSGTRSSLMALAVKYAGELKTHIEDVFDRLEELRWWKITKDSDSLSGYIISWKPANAVPFTPTTT